MKILFAIPRMNNGGAERVVANLANSFCDSHTVKVVTFVSGDSFYELDDRIKYASAPIELNRKSKITRILSLFRNVNKAYDFLVNESVNFKPDIIISFLFEADVFTYLLKVNKNINFKWISSERNDPQEYSYIKKKLFWKIYKKVDLFVCQSEYVSSYYSEIDESKKRVIANPINVSGIPTIKDECYPLKIVAIGRLMKQKNFNMLLEGFSKAKKEISDEVILYIFGEGPLRSQLEKKIQILGLEECTCLPGSVKDIYREITDACIFVMTSDYEGFPNVLLEAMAMGIPVIATDINTGTCKALVNDDMGILVPVGDAVALACAIRKMLKNTTYRMNIRGKHALSIQSQYGIDAISKEWINAMSSIL